MSMKRNNQKRDRSRSNSSDRDSYERSSKNKNERSRLSGGGMRMNRNSRKVYVSNINFDASYLEVKEEFNSVGEVTFVQMLKDESGRFKGCAVITFKEPEMAQEAIETMNRKEFKGRKLVVKEEDANPEYKTNDKKRSKDDFDRNPSMGMASSGNMSNPVNYNTYGLSMPFLNSLNIDLPLISIVFVANLDYTVTEACLKEVFSLAGKIVDIEIFKDKEGKSRGFGIVEYEHPVEAVQAISMLHNQTYKERTLTVRMDRSDRKKDNKPRLPAGLKSIGMGLGIDGKPLKDIKSLPAANPSLPSMSAMAPMGGQMNPVASLPSVNASSMSGQMAPGVGGLMDPLAARMGVNAGGNMGGGLATSPNVGMNMGQASNYRGGGGSLGNIIQLSNKCWTDNPTRDEY